ncbi:hypothetical protein PR048_009410 [Dryococelus australis]|uniref:Uncharacterized protein n=1 Tax=Dryococelus australis TaxID=614101 RepID=A0ABQ9HZV6_9NEOP|nr:hypothetical protein PR048_009410 [Dryococelus australis]
MGKLTRQMYIHKSLHALWLQRKQTELTPMIKYGCIGKLTRQMYIHKSLHALWLQRKQTELTPMIKYGCMEKLTRQMYIHKSLHDLWLQSKRSKVTTCFLPWRSWFYSRRSCPRFRHVGIVSDDAAGRLVFSGISRFPALSFRRCSMLISLPPHRLSRRFHVEKEPAPKEISKIDPNRIICWKTFPVHEGKADNTALQCRVTGANVKKKIKTHVALRHTFIALDYKNVEWLTPAAQNVHRPPVRRLRRVASWSIATACEVGLRPRSVVHPTLQAAPHDEVQRGEVRITRRPTRPIQLSGNAVFRYAVTVLPKSCCSYIRWRTSNGTSSNNTGRVLTRTSLPRVLIAAVGDALTGGRRDAGRQRAIYATPALATPLSSVQSHDRWYVVLLRSRPVQPRHAGDTHAPVFVAGRLLSPSNTGTPWRTSYDEALGGLGITDDTPPPHDAHCRYRIRTRTPNPCTLLVCLADPPPGVILKFPNVTGPRCNPNKLPHVRVIEPWYSDTTVQLWYNTEIAGGVPYEESFSRDNDQLRSMVVARRGVALFSTKSMLRITQWHSSVLQGHGVKVDVVCIRYHGGSLDFFKFIQGHRVKGPDPGHLAWSHSYQSLESLIPVSVSGQNGKLQNRSLNIPKSKPLPGTEGPEMPYMFVADEASFLSRNMRRTYSVTRPVIEPGSPWWEANRLTTQPPVAPSIVENQRLTWGRRSVLGSSCGEHCTQSGRTVAQAHSSYVRTHSYQLSPRREELRFRKDTICIDAWRPERAQWLISSAGSRIVINDSTRIGEDLGSTTGRSDFLFEEFSEIAPCECTSWSIPFLFLIEKGDPFSNIVSIIKWIAPAQSDGGAEPKPAGCHVVSSPDHHLHTTAQDPPLPLDCTVFHCNEHPKAAFIVSFDRGVYKLEFILNGRWFPSPMIPESS